MIKSHLTIIVKFLMYTEIVVWTKKANVIQFSFQEGGVRITVHFLLRSLTCKHKLSGDTPPNDYSTFQPCLSRKFHIDITKSTWVLVTTYDGNSLKTTERVDPFHLWRDLLPESPEGVSVRPLEVPVQVDVVFFRTLLIKTERKVPWFRVSPLRTQ